MRPNDPHCRVKPPPAELMIEEFENEIEKVSDADELRDADGIRASDSTNCGNQYTSALESTTEAT